MALTQRFLKKVEKDSEINLPGVEVTVERVDNKIRELTITSGGQSVRVRAGYDLEVLVSAKRQYKLTGKNIEAQVFDTAEEANAAKAEWVGSGKMESYDITIAEILTAV